MVDCEQPAMRAISLCVTPLATKSVICFLMSMASLSQLCLQKSNTKVMPVLITIV